MSITETRAARDRVPEPPHAAGLLSRLGVWSATHLRVVLIAWLAVIGVFGAFAPQVESALSGAGWQDSGSQSVKARDVIAKEFSGLGSTALQVVVQDKHATIAGDPAAQQVIAQATALLKADHRVSTVVPPRPGATISRDGRTAVIQAGANADPNEMVRAADDLVGPITRLSDGHVSVNLTGSSALWANFNKVNHSAMIKSEVLSWPVTMAVLVLAFGSLVAAGLPLMLTLVGLLTAAGALVIGTHIAPISIWAMNFAMMFALALGIDYALFIVVRFRAALKKRADATDAPANRQQATVAAVSETMGTAGKAVAFSGLTVLVSLSTVLLVPSPAFRSMALGIMLSVVAVLAATLTLLPAVLGRLGNRIDSGRVRFPGALERAEKRAEKRAATAAAASKVTGTEQRQPGDIYNGAHPHLHHSVAGLERMLHHWGAWLHRRPLVAGGLVLVVIGILAAPVLNLRTGMPSIAIIPKDQTARAGYNQVVEAFGPGAPGALSVVTPDTQAAAAEKALSADSGIAMAVPVGQHGGWTLLQAIPTTDASAKATGATIDRIRTELPQGSLVGGAAAENHDLEKVLSARTRWCSGCSSAWASCCC